MTTPLQATKTSNLSSATSGLYRVEIDTDPLSTTNTWVEVKGIQKWEPKYEQVTEDNTDISDGGWASEYPTGNKFTVDIDGLVKGLEDPTFVVDPGVQAMLNAAEKFGKAGLVHMRYWRTDSLPEAKEFTASCKMSKTGDKPPKLQSFSGSLMALGQPTDISKPTADSNPVVKILTVASTVTGFKLTLNGTDTATITYTTSTPAATVQSAVQAVSGFSSATVTGANGGPFTLTLPSGATVSSSVTAGTGNAALS